MITVSELSLFKSKCNKLPSPNILYYIITSVCASSLRISAAWLRTFSDIISGKKKLSTVFMQNNERNGPWVDQKEVLQKTVVYRRY